LTFICHLNKSWAANSNSKSKRSLQTNQLTWLPAVIHLYHQPMFHYKYSVWYSWLIVRLWPRHVHHHEIKTRTPTDWIAVDLRLSTLANAMAKSFSFCTFVCSSPGNDNGGGLSRGHLLVTTQ